VNLEKVKTVGAYVLYNGLFPFQVGPTKRGDTLGVVRIGGHREKNESILETARREVFEETTMDITLYKSPKTFFYKNANENPIDIKIDIEIPPICIIERDDQSLSVMYLAYSETAPIPSSETKGLLLLTPREIHSICKNKLTLRDYLTAGGKYLFKENMPETMILQPFPQLILLSKLLHEQPVLMDQFIIVH
jgi:8-oxo-dGTP pyrophosphatase MutT (NUDIX family)